MTMNTITVPKRPLRAVRRREPARGATRDAVRPPARRDDVEEPARRRAGATTAVMA